jgi:hypothetical protein
LVVVAIALIAIARELEWVRIPVPQLKRQTKRVWAVNFHGTVAAALWGLDLGLILTTWLTFSGVWLLVIVAILGKQATFGGMLFVSYWLGRALSVWIAPLLIEGASDVPKLLESTGAHYRLFKQVHVWSLVWLIFVLVSLLVGLRFF